jgi:peptide/nickel transport system ATP-binding protein
LFSRIFLKKLDEIKKELKLSLIFITHDLNIAKHISDNIMILYFGKLVEMNSSKEIFSNPLHPYTKKLISSVPTFTSL